MGRNVEGCWWVGVGRRVVGGREVGGLVVGREVGRRVGGGEGGRQEGWWDPMALNFSSHWLLTQVEGCWWSVMVVMGTTK
jgi:hypothetical protein